MKLTAEQYAEIRRAHEAAGPWPKHDCVDCGECPTVAQNDAGRWDVWCNDHFDAETHADGATTTKSIIGTGPTA